MNKPDEHFSNKVIWLSFLMSISVMYIHADNLNNTGFYNIKNSFDYHITLLLSNAVGGMAVPFFFMMSGYWYFRFDIFENSAVKTVIFKLKKRITSLGIPYLCWNTSGMLFYMCITRIPALSGMMNSSETIPVTAETIIKGIFFHAQYFPFWYLQDLIVLTAVTPLILLMLRKKRITEIIIILMLILNATGTAVSFFRPASVLFFVLGGYFSAYHRSFFEKRHTIKCCLAAGLCLLFRVFSCMHMQDSPFLNTLTLLLSSVSLPVAADCIENYNITWFKKQSFFIYASHIIPVTVVMKILSKMSFGDISATVSYLVTPWIALVIIYAAAKIWNTTMPGFYRVFCGGRV